MKRKVLKIIKDVDPSASTGKISKYKKSRLLRVFAAWLESINKDIVGFE